jgi:membrane-associated phospholipid phosphatase
MIMKTKRHAFAPPSSSTVGSTVGIAACLAMLTLTTRPRVASATVTETPDRKATDVVASTTKPITSTTKPIDYDLDFHLWFAGSAAAAWAALEIVKYTAGPTECRWCDRTDQGYPDLNTLDRTMRRVWLAPRSAHTHLRNLSHVLAFGLIPAGGLAVAAGLAASPRPSGVRADGFWTRFLVSSLILVEAAAVASCIYQIVAMSAGRQRPEAHFAIPPATGEVWQNISFFSGHTTLAFSLVTAAGTLARLQKWRWEGLVWAVGLPLAMATGYSRAAADRHYFTDVLAGAAVGSLVGWGIATLGHHISFRPTVTVAPSSSSPNTTTVGVSGSF